MGFCCLSGHIDDVRSVVIEGIHCGHSAIVRARAIDLTGKVLACTQCGQRQRMGERREVRLPGFRQEGDHWIVVMANGQRRRFESNAAAWQWLDKTAPSRCIETGLTGIGVMVGCAAGATELRPCGTKTRRRPLAPSVFPPPAPQFTVEPS
jgi:hypothetical protein